MASLIWPQWIIVWASLKRSGFKGLDNVLDIDKLIWPQCIMARMAIHFELKDNGSDMVIESDLVSIDDGLDMVNLFWPQLTMVWTYCLEQAVVAYIQ